MNLSFGEVSHYVIMESAFCELGLESLSSESNKINKKIYTELLSMESEYNRAIQDGDYKTAIDICDRMIKILDDANDKLKSLKPEKCNEGLRIFAYMLVMIAGIVSFSANPFIMDKVGSAFYTFVKKLTGKGISAAAGAGMAVGGVGSFVGSAAITFKGYFELLKHAYAPKKDEFAGDPHANNVDYRMAASGIREAKQIVMNLRNNTSAYLKDMNQKASESDLSLLMDCAIESIDINDIINDPAMESLSSDTKKAQKEFMKKARDIYQRVGAAFNKGDYDETVNGLEDLEKVTNEFDRKLDEMKKDGVIIKGFGTVVKFAIIILGVIAVFKPGTFTMPLTSTIGKIVKLITGGTAAGTGQVAATLTIHGANFAVGSIGFSAIFNTITKAFKARKAKRENPDDPRYANGDYAAAKEIVKELRGLIARARIEAMSMKREHPQMT